MKVWVAKLWVLSVGVSWFLAGCGGRTGPYGLEFSAAAAGSSQGGSSSSGFGGSTTGGLGGSTAGGLGGASGKGGSAGATSQITRRWFAMASGEKSAPELYLVGVGSDHQIDAHVLAKASGGTDPRIDGPGFNPSGNRFAYLTRSNDVERFWVVDVNSTTFTARELKLPAGAPQGRYSIRKWLTDNLLVVDRELETPPSDSPVSSTQLVLSLDPNVPAPIGTVDSGQTSPDGTKSVQSIGYISDRGAEMVVYGVDANHMLGESLLSLSGVSTVYWSRNSRRLAVLRAPWEAPSVVVYDFPDNGVPIEIDRIEPAKGAIVGVGFSPDARFATYDVVFSTAQEKRIRDLAKHTEAVLRLANGVSQLSEIEWIANDRIVTPASPSLERQPFQVVTITEAAVAQGTITMTRPADPSNPPGDVVARQWLGGDQFLVLRGVGTDRILQSAQLTDTALLSKNLLPGTVAAAEPGVLGYLTSYDGLHALIVPAAPTYYYMTFQGIEVTRSIALFDFFGQNYHYFQNVLNAGILARETATQRHAWLYIDAADSGPLVTIPVRPGSADPKFYIPPKWPSN